MQQTSYYKRFEQDIYGAEVADKSVEKMDDYTAGGKVVQGPGSARKRPRVYFGDSCKTGLHNLIYEIIDSAVDEAYVGRCKNITVVLSKDNAVIVKDDRNSDALVVHSASRNVLDAVSVLTEWIRFDIHHDGKVHSVLYSKGNVTPQAGNIKDTDYNGAIVSFKPDEGIFQSLEFEYEHLKERMAELSFLNKDLKLTLVDERYGKTNEFCSPGGIIEFVNYLNHGCAGLHEPVYFVKRTETAEIEIALQYSDGYNAIVHGFVNGVKTIGGGGHIVGFRTAITRAINRYARSNGLIGENRKISGDDAIEGLTAVLNVKIPNPVFEGRMNKLGNVEIQNYVHNTVYECLESYFEEHPVEAERVLAKAINAMEAREAAQKAKDSIRKRNVFESSIPEENVASNDDCNASLVALGHQVRGVLPSSSKIIEKVPVHALQSGETIVSIESGFDDNEVRFDKTGEIVGEGLSAENLMKLLMLERMYGSVIKQGRNIYIAKSAALKERVNELGKLIDESIKDDFDISREYDVFSSIRLEQIDEPSHTSDLHNIMAIEQQLAQIEAAIGSLKERKKVANENWENGDYI